MWTSLCGNQTGKFILRGVIKRRKEDILYKSQFKSQDIKNKGKVHIIPFMQKKYLVNNHQPKKARAPLSKGLHSPAQATITMGYTCLATSLLSLFINCGP